MKPKNHLTLLAQATAVWAFFWVLGLPAYYQQYSAAMLGVGSVLLSALISLAAVAMLLRPARRRSRAFWLSVYYSFPLALYDALYCGAYLGHGAGYLPRYWYLTVFYLSVWLTFLPTAWLLDRADAQRARTP